MIQRLVGKVSFLGSTFQLARAVFARSRKSLARDQRGATAVEMALVTPFLLTIMVGTIDASSLFFVKNNMVNVARETARDLAVGAVTVKESEKAAFAKLSGWSQNFSISSKIGDPADPTNQDVQVQISVRMAEVLPIPMPFFDRSMFNGNLSTEISMRLETATPPPAGGAS